MHCELFFNRLGEIRDRSFENQRHRASGLNLVVAAITLWNTVYFERAADLLAKSSSFDPALLQHFSPLGWERINLTGDCSFDRYVAYLFDRYLAQYEYEGRLDGVVNYTEIRV